MTQVEYNCTNWSRGNVVRLTNGKEYTVAGLKKRYLILKSEEFNTHFIADYRIIAERTSDAVEIEEKPVPVAQEPAPVRKKRPRIKRVELVERPNF